MEKRKKDPAAVSMAKKRAASLTPERRTEIAKKAAAARVANLRKRQSALRRRQSAA